MKTKKLGRGAKISLPLLFLMLAALLVAALSGVFGAPGGASAGEASSEAAVSEALPADGDPEGVLILWAIDVGQGDGLLLRMPTGEHVLVDSGVNTDKNAVPDFLREKGVEEIEYAVFTHPHADHIGAAAEVVRGFRVKNVYMPDVAHTSKTYLDLLDALEADESVSVRRAVAGESFSIGEVTFDILSPIEDKYSDLNLYSAVLRVTYREKRFLLMGDAEQPNETALLASGESLRADLLKVGHHGSSTSSSADFLRAVRPDCALISCGEGQQLRASRAGRARPAGSDRRGCLPHRPRRHHPRRLRRKDHRDHDRTNLIAKTRNRQAAEAERSRQSARPLFLHPARTGATACSAARRKSSPSARSRARRPRRRQRRLPACPP